LSVLKEYSLFGVGPDSLMEEINDIVKYGDNKPIDNALIDKAHSEPLHIAVTTGVPSMIAYLIFSFSLILERFITILRDLKKSYDKLDNDNTIFEIMLFISALSYFIQALINISVIHVAPMYWAMLGMMAGSMLDKKIVNENNTAK
jgi:putative inorganic carbon (HCO3(-)) transporter